MKPLKLAMKNILIKRNILIGATLVILFIIGAVVFSPSRNVPEYLKEIYPNQTIINFKGHYVVDETEVFTKEVSVGKEKLYIVVEIKENQASYYRFYSADAEPKLLKEVGATTPFDYDVDDDFPFERTFLQKDITGDGVDELFVQIQRSGSSLTSWEILRLENEVLVNIRKGFENSNWVDFDEAYFENGYTVLTWHGSDIRGAHRYVLEGNELIDVQGVSFELIEGDESACNVSVITSGNENAETVYLDERKEDCSIWTESFESYWDKAPLVESEFKQDLDSALTDSRWKPLATVYKEQCSRFGEVGTVLNANLNFRELVLSQKASVDVPEGKLLLVPCILGAYQTSQIIVLDDGQTYEAIPISYIDEEGNQKPYYRVSELQYDQETGIFTNFVKHRAMADCWAESTFKYVDRKFVLQKYVDKEECDGTFEGGKVLYDINQN